MENGLVMKIETALHFKDDRSDKLYIVRVEESANAGYQVFTTYGRRGGTMKTDEKKRPAPMGRDEAMLVHDALVQEKRAKGYRDYAGNAPQVQKPEEQHGAATSWQEMMGADGPTSHMLLNEIEVSEAKALLNDSAYMLQPKFDGVRAWVSKSGSSIKAVSRSGKPIALPQMVVEYLATQFSPSTSVLDGELIGDTLVVFDVLLAGNGMERWRESAELRIAWLDKRFGLDGPVIRTITAFSASEKHMLYRALLDQGMEGVVFKRKDAPYVSGRTDKALKCKFVATASVICGGQKAVISKRTAIAKRSVVMLLADGAEVGAVTIPVNQEIPQSGDVIEVRYLYRHDVGGDLIQPVYLGIRDDISRTACTAAQFQIKGAARA